MPDLVARVDAALGDGLERLVRDHHRRRLRAAGWQRALDPPGDELWAAGDPPPRQGNAVEVLIDGQQAFGSILRDLRSASSHVHFAGWHLEPEFDLARSDERVVVRDLFIQLAERVDVRVLLWSGAPVPPPVRPSRRDTRRVGEALQRGSRVQFAVDNKERPLHCHHEKIFVIDDEIAYVGGIDLSSFDGDRFDSSEHVARAAVGWHDATTRLRGPIVADVARHFAFRWREVTGTQLAEPEPRQPAGTTEVQLVRTVPEKIYDSLPRGDFRILEAYNRALRSAQRLIYLENQFLWSPQIVELLREKLANPPTDDFRLVVVLPSKPTTGADDTRGQLGILTEADSGDRMVACTPYARAGAHADPIYVHAKIGIVDDRWLTIGSANLNNHSLFNDSEVNVVMCDEHLARDTRLRLWAEHLEVPIEDVAGDPTALVDHVWKPTAQEQRRRRDEGLPLTARIAALPQVSKRSMRLLGPLQGLVVDG